MTAQVSERLIYGGKEISLFTNPLSLYLQNARVSFDSPHTANWRGYVGTWQILEHAGIERLYLVDLIAYKGDRELCLGDVFPGYERVFSHWFTGQLRCPQGAQLAYRHMGYSSIYEYDLLMDFKQGVLVGTHARHNQLPEETQEDRPSFLKRGVQ